MARSTAVTDTDTSDGHFGLQFTTDARTETSHSNDMLGCHAGDGIAIGYLCVLYLCNASASSAQLKSFCNAEYANKRTPLANVAGSSGWLIQVLS